MDTVVRSLLLDSANTAVTDATAEELLRRRDPAGLRLIAAAWHLAEPEQGDHLTGCLSAVFFELAGAGPEDRLRFRVALRSLLDDPDPAVQAGARDLLDRVARALPD
ncbi:hypothetical protein [Micromonospora sp. DH14]|uniref:hypothetical protein n=1 Tax=Micromonospora sp. DH14 TaxID=3040120 RepID=UPI0024434586|nr:hypothetical protein [Micromonospora sp. DH14]MDG9675389.1 hypothetical protein [Micromonospora sp. DH14]